MSNVEFIYLYRDGSNYKKFGRVVFSNPEQLNPEALEVELRRVFWEGDLFIASQIRVPDVFLYAGGKFSFDDHCYHEFGGLWATEDISDDRHDRSISEFLAEVDREDHRGWKTFDPIDSEGSLNGYMHRWA
jgi:hypothetical protein